MKKRIVWYEPYFEIESAAYPEMFRCRAGRRLIFRQQYMGGTGDGGEKGVTQAVAETLYRYSDTGMPIFKDEIDALAAGSSIELREKLFCALEREREETGFSNFTIRKRYLYIRLLSVREGRNLIDTVKELVPRLLDSGDYRQVNMRGAVSDFPSGFCL